MNTHTCTHARTHTENTHTHLVSSTCLLVEESKQTSASLDIDKSRNVATDPAPTCVGQLHISEAVGVCAGIFQVNFQSVSMEGTKQQLVYKNLG